MNTDEYTARYEQWRRDRLRKEADASHKIPDCHYCKPRPDGIQQREIPGTGLVAVLHDVDLDDGVMTVRFRFFNEAAKPARLVVDPASAYETLMVRVGEEELFMLKDEGGELEAKSRLDLDLDPGEMVSWWAKFPAPPPGTRTFDLELPPLAQFQDVPVDYD